MTLSGRKVILYLAAFCVAILGVIAISKVPFVTLITSAIVFALLWVATLSLERTGARHHRGPLSACVCGLLVFAVGTFLFADSDQTSLVAQFKQRLSQPLVWCLIPPALFCGLCLVSLTRHTNESRRIVSVLPDIGFGVAFMTTFYVLLQAIPSQDFQAFWGNTAIHYLILFVFFTVASYISRCFLSIWYQQSNTENAASLLPREISLRRFVRVVISTLPLLGFLGTVIGITQALSGLPALFAGDGDLLGRDVSGALGSSLASIAVAFETTMLGLIASLITSVTLSYAEKMETDLSAHTDG